MTPEQIARNAAAIRNAGIPDALNRWLAMTPEAWAQNEQTRERLNLAINHGERTMAQKIGPREQALRKAREDKQPRATPAQPATPVVKQESTMAKKTKAKSSKARTSVKGKTAKAETSGVRPGSKLEIIVGLLKQENGTTTKEVLAKTGWPAVSLPQQAKAAGLTLTKEKKDGVTIYRAA